MSSYEYHPAFIERGQADFAALDPWLQEAVLDEIERLLAAMPPPTVARRLAPPTREVHDFTVSRDGAAHYLFLTTLLNVVDRQLGIARIGHLRRA